MSHEAKKRVRGDSWHKKKDYLVARSTANRTNEQQREDFGGTTDEDPFFDW